MYIHAARPNECYVRDLVLNYSKVKYHDIVDRLCSMSRIEFLEKSDETDVKYVHF